MANARNAKAAGEDLWKRTDKIVRFRKMPNMLAIPRRRQTECLTSMTTLPRTPIPLTSLFSVNATCSESSFRPNSRTPSCSR